MRCSGIPTGRRRCLPRQLQDFAECVRSRRAAGSPSPYASCDHTEENFAFFSDGLPSAPRDDGFTTLADCSHKRLAGDEAVQMAYGEGDRSRAIASKRATGKGGRQEARQLAGRGVRHRLASKVMIGRRIPDTSLGGFSSASDHQQPDSSEP